MSLFVRWEIPKTLLNLPWKHLSSWKQVHAFWSTFIYPSCIPKTPGRFGVFYKFELPTQSHCPLSEYTVMQNRVWQSKRCLLHTLIIHLLLEGSCKWKSYTLSPLKNHQVRRGSLHQLKRLQMKIHRKDRFQ